MWSMFRGWFYHPDQGNQPQTIVETPPQQDPIAEDDPVDQGLIEDNLPEVEEDIDELNIDQDNQQSQSTTGFKIFTDDDDGLPLKMKWIKIWIILKWKEIKT